MKKWMTTPPPLPQDISVPRRNSKDSLTTVLEENLVQQTVKEEQKEENIYDQVDHYRRPPTPTDSHNDYAISSPSVPSVPSEYSYEDPYYETGMFSGPVTDLDEDSDPDEIKVYNPATKTISIRKGEGNVNVNINVNLTHLEQDIQRMIDEMTSLEFNGSVSSVSTRPDSGISSSQDGKSVIERETGETKTVKSAPGATYGSKNRRLFWNGNNKWSVERDKTEKDIQNVTCLVNENFDENRVFKSSVNGVPLGMTPTGQLGPPKQAWRNGSMNGSGSKVRRRPKRVSAARKGRHDGGKTFCSMVGLAIAILLVSTTYFCVANIQSTLHKELGLGMMFLMTEKTSKLVCVLFIPTIITRWPGRRWGAALGALLCCAWPAAQLLLPEGRVDVGAAEAAVASAVQGLGAALLWGAALPLAAEMTEARGDAAVTFALGALLAVWQLGQTAAGVLNTAVMVRGESWLPEALEAGAGVETACRAGNACPPAAPADAAELLRELHVVWPPLVAAPVVAALLLALAVRPPAKAGCALDASGPGGRHGLLSPLRQLGGCRQLLLVPSAALSGMLDAFVTADYTMELSGCAWGGARAGAGPAVAGLAHAAAVLLLAPLAGRRGGGGRASVGALCALLLAVAGATLACSWAADRAAPRRMLLPAALAGAGASLDVVAAAAAALAFPERRAMAFSFLLAARAGGALVQLSLSDALCLDGKLLVLGGALLVAFACTAALERLWGAGAPPPAQGLSTAGELDSRAGDSDEAGDDGMVEVPLDRPRHW
ncbi:hypothetical protein R5R35_001966 [Gryllus longicercus]|uniref:Uncharacterized protein n=1 Tax=Gryllus longicercus TaxID=2509291 RepID=A0AAN9W1X9_9ORTH